jgi:hypothetical protein
MYKKCSIMGLYSASQFSKKDFFPARSFLQLLYIATGTLVLTGFIRVPEIIYPDIPL